MKAPARNLQCLSSALRAAKCLTIVNRLNSEIVKDGLDTDTYVGNNLVKVFGNWGRLGEARAAFERIARKSVYSWTIVISAYIQNGNCSEALALFRRMEREGVRANEVTLTAVLGACAMLKSISLGRSVHGRLETAGANQLDEVVGNALINMYGKCGSLAEAKAVFNTMARRDAVSWTSLITAYSENLRWKQAIRIFWKMVRVSGAEPTEVTCMSVLGACLSLGELEETRAVHRHISATGGLDRRMTVANKLIFTYGKCGSPKDARRVFDHMPQRNAVSWTSMIAAYTQNSQPRFAVKLFLNVLEACSAIGSLHLGRKMHARIAGDGFQDEVKVATAVLTMYSKCGSLVEARRTFDRMTVKSLVSWNVMMEAYTHHGEAKQTSKLFQMLCLDGACPDAISFVTLLFSCSHAGMLQEGCEFFGSMRSDFEVERCVDHYVCMVDMLGRAGWIEDAETLLMKVMPVSLRESFAPTLLAACRFHGSIETAERVSGQLFSCQSPSPTSVVLFMLTCDIFEACEKDSCSSDHIFTLERQDLQRNRCC